MKANLPKLMAFALAGVLAVGLGVAAAYAGGPKPPKEHKVEICHVPPGNPGNAHTIEVDGSAIPAHLEHGDTLGACGESTTPTETTPTGTTPTETTPTETTPTTPTPTTPAQPRCPPGEGPYDGKDGDETEPGHNDECCPDSNNNQICDYKESGTTKPLTPPGPTVTTAATTPSTTTTPSVPGKTTSAITKVKVVKVTKAKKSGKLTGDPKVDRCRKENGLFECTTSTGKKITVVPGWG
jgi:hypothetical protein